MRTDEHTESLIELCKTIGTIAVRNQKRYFIGGGLSVDFSLGTITRPHEDIDLVVDRLDTAWWQDQFKRLGYEIGHSDYMAYFPDAFTVNRQPKDDEDFLVEVWPMEYREDGSLVPIHTADHPGREWWSGKHQRSITRVEIDGVPIWVEDANAALNQKLDHVRHHREPLEEKHIHDLELLGRKGEYGELVKRLGLG